MRFRTCQAAILLELLLIMLLVSGHFMDKEEPAAVSGNIKIAQKNTKEGKKDFIKWVDFTVSCEALDFAYEKDVEARQAGTKLDWIALLAYTSAKTGGVYDKKAMKEMQKMAAKAADEADETHTATAILDAAGESLTYYPYYKEAYSAILSGMVGEYQVQMPQTDGGAAGEKQADSDAAGKKQAGGSGAVEKQAAEQRALSWHQVYGLKAFSPIAKGFDYSDYDDFGSSRSYGYSRPHLGHDMMGQVGTPVIAIESGYVEVLGWNQYGGWRIGIRSFDKKRYYYYAHLRQNYPYQADLKEGDTVTAGEVIGYMGHTGYSAKENVNNIKTTHLHWGMELVFDESQKESDNEIWIDCYQLSRFLRKHQSSVEKVAGTKEWRRVLDMVDPAVVNWEKEHPGENKPAGE